MKMISQNVVLYIYIYIKTCEHEMMVNLLFIAVSDISLHNFYTWIATRVACNRKKSVR